MSDETRPEAIPRRNLYGRRQGKRLRGAKRGYMDNDLAEYQLAGVDGGRAHGREEIDISALFPDHMPVWLEIGFGSGEHLVHLARNHRDTGLIGAEHYVNGVAALLGKLRGADVDNVRIHPGDVRDLFDVLPPASLERVYLLYPDPWPKKKHHRRRFVTPEYLDPLATAMKPGAELRIATDIGDYVRQTLEMLTRHESFVWLGECADDWRSPWPDWSRTRYEAKALREGRLPHYLRFRRL